MVAKRFLREQNSGIIASGANLVRPAAASVAPRTAGNDRTASVHATSAPTRASFEFMLSEYSVNGLAAQANASTTPSRRDPSLQPATNNPTTARMSNADAAT